MSLLDELMGDIYNGIGVSEDFTVPLWEPDPDNIPQQMAFECEADELYYGGAAGGGKTDLLIGLSVTKHKKSLILRRQQSQMPEIENRYWDLLGSNNKHGQYNSQKKQWRFVGKRNSIIELSGCDEEKDKEKFKGRAHDLKAYDELPDFSETQYMFINGWNRSAEIGQRCRIVGAGNPPTTADGEWVIKRWADWIDESTDAPAAPGELRWYATINNVDTRLDGPEPYVHNGEEIFPRSRTFIPASLEDNSYLNNGNYRSILSNLPEEWRDKLLKGDFRVMRGTDPWQVIPTEWIKAAQARWTTDGWKGKIIDQVGVDPALGGGDNMVIITRHGSWFSTPVVHKGREIVDGPTAAKKVIEVLDGAYPMIALDVIGIGSTCKDSLVGFGHRVTPMVNNGSAPKSATDKSGRHAFYNWRAYAMWMLREALDPANDSKIAIPPDATLFRDLAAPRFTLQKGAKHPVIQIESKQDIKKRIGRSPDYGDSFINAFVRPHTGWAGDKAFLDRLLNG